MRWLAPVLLVLALGAGAAGQEGAPRTRDHRLAPDGRTAGVLVLIEVETGRPGERVEVAEALRLSRDGRRLRTLVPGGFIRAWGFVEGGAQVAVYTGALHFAGWYFLYDVESGRELAVSQDPVDVRSPPWVRAIAP